MHTLPRGGAGGTTDYVPLSTAQRLGLAGLGDCKGSYFTVNISVIIVGALLVFMLGVIVTNDTVNAFFDNNVWEGQETGVFICEKNTLGANGTRIVERQTINAMTATAYLLAGLFCGTLGAYDYISWNAKKLEGDFEEEEDERPGDMLQGNRRNSVRSVNTVATMGTVRSGESQLSERALGQVTTAISQTIRRRDFRAYIMSERGSPALVVRQPVWSLLLMIALIFLGLTGFIFHASYTRLGRRLDEFAFFVVLTHNVAYSWGRLLSDGLKWKFWCVDLTQYQDRSSRSSRLATLFFLVLAGVLDFGMYLYLQLVGETDLEFAILLLFLFMFVLPIFLHWYLRSEDITSFWLLFVSAILIFGVGELLRRQDEEGYICDPGSFFQAHSVYHMCTATALALLYLFFRSDAWSRKAVEEYFERYPLPPAVNSPNVTQDVEAGRVLANSRRGRGISARSGDGEFGGRVGSGEVGEEGAEVRQSAAALLASRRSAARSASRRKKAASAVRTGNSEAELKRRILEAQNTTGAEVEAMWTCPECGYNDNPLDSAQCHQCQGPRPNLSDMEVIPHAAGLNVNARPTRNSNKRNSNKRASIPRQGATNANKRSSQGGQSVQGEGVNSNSRDRSRSRERSRERKKKRFDSLKKQQVIPVAQTTPVNEDEREKYERQRIKTMERVRMRTLERQKQRELLKQKSMEQVTEGEGQRNSGPRSPQPQRLSNQRASNQRASNTRLSNSRDRREVAAVKRASQRSAAQQKRESQRAAAQQRRESQRSARASRQRRTTGQGNSTIVAVPLPLNQQGTGDRPRAPGRPHTRTGDRRNGNTSGIVPPPSVRKSKARSKTRDRSRDKIDDDPPI